MLFTDSVQVGGGEAGGWRVNRRSPFCSSLGKCFISGIAERVLKMKVLCGQSGVPRAPASFIMERKWHLNPPYSTQLPAYPSPQTLRAEQLSPSCLEAKMSSFCHRQNVDDSKVQPIIYFSAVYPHPMIHNNEVDQCNRHM